MQSRGAHWRWCSRHWDVTRNGETSGTGTPADLTTPYEFRPGAQLVHRSSLDVNAVDTEVLTSYFNSSDYDVKDLNVSPDGQFVIFAAHGPLSNAHDHTWSIYEYSFKEVDFL